MCLYLDNTTVRDINDLQSEPWRQHNVKVKGQLSVSVFLWDKGDVRQCFARSSVCLCEKLIRLDWFSFLGDQGWLEYAVNDIQ